MTQKQRREYLIRALLRERRSACRIPPGEAEQRRLLRALFNLRPPAPASEAFLSVQDAYLQARLAERGVTHPADLQPVQPGLYLWQGDITTLAADGIVNAANSTLLGCFVPGHGCIDNAIHTFAGVQLRLACAGLMQRQDHAEAPGGAKITPAYNLPSRRVLHTVGPVITGAVTQEDRACLADCYRACLALAAEHGLRSLAFCCISTGEFRFPAAQAAQIAIQTVQAWQRQNSNPLEVIFNVWKDSDRALYQRLLG